MSKSANKNVREPIGEQTGVNKMTDDDKARLSFGHQKRMDVDHYIQMDEYKNKKLFFQHIQTGEADKWISLGAEPVRRMAKSSKLYKGINDREESEYHTVRAVSVVDGQPIDAVLLCMDPIDYQKYRIDPKEARNEEIREAMGIGKVTEDSKVMSNTKGLKTYAPYTSGDNTGLEIERSGQILHDV